MTDEQSELLDEALDSIAAARLLLDGGYAGYAAARAYYAMFYAAEAFLLTDALTYSKHSAVIAAFGERYARTGRVSPLLHRYLIEAQTLRHAGDYGERNAVTPDQATEQVRRANEFVEQAREWLDNSAPPEPAT